ncbi:MAG: TlpA family protein disulfide reductase [Halanaerobiales bacterium]|nr:TlpA family protein disulfide reductase [Halanaerobiales bacterium]
MSKWIVSLLLFVFLIGISCSAFALEVGDMLPDFNLKDLEGNDVKISDFQGQYVLYDVWATWCGPCRKALKAYTQNIDKFKEAGIKIVALSVDAKVDAVHKYLKKNDMAFTVLHVDRGEKGKYRPTKELWGVKGIPTMFIVDPEGKIVFKEIGFGDFASLWDEIIKTVDVKQVSGSTYPVLKVGSYKTEKVKVDLMEIGKDITISNFISYDYKDCTEQSEVALYKVPESNKPWYGIVYIEGEAYTMLGQDTDSDELGLLDLIYVDYNHNFDLTDDGEPVQLSVTEDGKEAKITLEVTNKYGEVIPYGITLWSEDWGHGYVMFVDRAYEAYIETDSEPVRVLLVDVDKNGIYTDESDAVLIDIDRNGMFDSYYSVQEWTKLGYTYELGQYVYKFKIVEYGRKIVVEKVQ